MSQWEHQAARRSLKEQGVLKINHRLLDETAEKQRKITDSAVEKKKGAAREEEKRHRRSVAAGKSDTPARTPSPAEPVQDAALPPDIRHADGLDFGDLSPLDDVNTVTPGDPE